MRKPGGREPLLYCWNVLCVVFTFAGIQVWGIIYMYKTMAFLTKTRRMRFGDLREKKQWKKKLFINIFLCCHLDKIHFQFCSLLFKQNLEVIKCCLQNSNRALFLFCIINFKNLGFDFW